MAFTYTGPNSDRERVRLRIGDTVEQQYSLTDDEVDESLSIDSKVAMAAVLAHEWFMGRLANYITSSAGGQSKQLQQRYDMHERLHKALIARANKCGELACYAGGISQDRLDDAADDADYPDPFASVGRDDINIVYNDKKDD